MQGSTEQAKIWGAAISNIISGFSGIKKPAKEKRIS
jgi:hypothetical protein